MATKFVSKNSNYMIVLKPGVEGNRALGTHAVSGLYVKFQSGSVDIKEESIVAMLRAHPSFGVDFVEVKDSEVDPYADERVDIEPQHTTANITYGHVEKKNVGRPAKVKLTPQLKKIIEGEAIKMIPDLLKSNPKILRDIISNMAAEMKAAEPQKEESVTEQLEAKKPTEE